MYSKIMIWANVTKFGQNFIATPKFFGLVRVWQYMKNVILVIFIKAVAELGMIPYTHLFIVNFLLAIKPKIFKIHKYFSFLFEQ